MTTRKEINAKLEDQQLESVGEECFPKDEITGLVNDYKAGEVSLNGIQKYLNSRAAAFAADRTRVASMRAMAAQFVEDINSVLKIV